MLDHPQWQEIVISMLSKEIAAKIWTPEDKVRTTEDTSYRQCAPIYSSSVSYLGEKPIGLDEMGKKKKEKSTEYKAEGKEEGERGIN